MADIPFRILRDIIHSVSHRRHDEDCQKDDTCPLQTHSPRLSPTRIFRGEWDGTWIVQRNLQNHQKHVDQMAQQLLTKWTYAFSCTTSTDIHDIEDHLPCTDIAPPVWWTTEAKKGIVFYEKNDRVIDHHEVLLAVLLQNAMDIRYGCY